MAKVVTLKDLTDTLVKDISTSTKEVRKTKYNKKVHLLRVSTDLLWKEIEPQLAGTNYDVKLIYEALERCTKSIYKTATEEAGNRNPMLTTGFTVIVKSAGRVQRTTNDTNFEVLVASNTGRGSAFNKANSLKAAAERQLNKDLQRMTGISVKFDLGHEVSVAEHHRNESIATFFDSVRSSNLSVPYSVKKSVTYKMLNEINIEAKKERRKNSSYIIKLKTKFPEFKEVLAANPGLDDIIISTIAEDFVSNQGKGASAEQKLINAARRAAIDVQKRISFASVRASPTDIETITANIVESMIKIGGKPKKGTKRQKVGSFYASNTTNSFETNKQLEISAGIASSSSVSVDKLKRPSRGQKQSAGIPETRNWSSLLPLLNAKLTPRVIANMRFPSLVNRTGTFARSAEIVSVETTRDGFPSFVFDYERDPYDVFDRTKGRAPWNTPERDPRALVDRSVREVVKEMAIERFYTRRAR